VAARVRAALAYSGDGFADIGERSGLGQAKLRRIASQTNPRGATPGELWAIADACGVPRAWLEIGEWNDDAGQADAPLELGPFGVGSTTERLELVERYLLALLRIEASRAGGALPLPAVGGESDPQPAELDPLPDRATSGSTRSRSRRSGRDTNGQS
jgi:hypothetical protein